MHIKLRSKATSPDAILMRRLSTDLKGDGHRKENSAEVALGGHGNVAQYNQAIFPRTCTRSLANVRYHRRPLFIIGCAINLLEIFNYNLQAAPTTL